MEAVIHHDRTSRLAALYARHAPSAGRLAYLLTGDADLAEDLAQEAFARLIARLGSIRDEAAIAAYLRRSIVNLVRKHWRKARSERSYLRREGRNLATQAALLPDVAEQDELWRALQELPHRQRAAIVLRFYEDLSEAETAAPSGIAHKPADCQPAASCWLTRVVRQAERIAELGGAQEPDPVSWCSRVGV